MMRSAVLTLVSACALLAACVSTPLPAATPGATTFAPGPTAEQPGEPRSLPGGVATAATASLRSTPTVPGSPSPVTPTQVPAARPQAAAGSTAPPSVTTAAARPATAVPTSRATALSTPQVSVGLYGDAIVDGEHGRLFMRAKAGTDERIAVLRARDGLPERTLAPGGPFAVDPKLGRVFVDGPRGLTVLDAGDGGLLGEFALPVPGEGITPPAPVADWERGRVYAFRANVVHVFDSASGTRLDAVPFNLTPQDNCRIPHEQALPVVGARIDPPAGLMHLDFTTYACTPWIGHSIVSYDVLAGKEVGQSGAMLFTAAAAGGRLFVWSWYRFGIGTLFSVENGRMRASTTDWSGGPGAPVQIDGGRGLLYLGMHDSQTEPAAPDTIRVFDAGTLQLRREVRLPGRGRLVGFDATTDLLYILDSGKLRTVSAGTLSGNDAQEAAPARPGPVTRLAVAGESLFRVLGDQNPPGKCYVFAQYGGSLQRGSAQSWQPANRGLPPGCDFISALAASPGYAADRTVFAGVAGSGLYRSTDGGESWGPFGGSLPSAGISQIVLSPAFVQDRTAFAAVRTGPLQRSTDGGELWHSLPVTATHLSIAPDFADERSLAALAFDAAGNMVVKISQDGGDRWRDLPAPPALRGVSIAPAFSRWAVQFGVSSDGIVYRGGGRGASWDTVLHTGLQDVTGITALYGPDEAHRAVYLLLHAAGGGKLIVSQDGGVSWRDSRLPAGVVPTAIAASGPFVEAGRIFVGTAAGEVLTVTP